MSFEIKIPLPDPMQKDIGIDEDTPLETFFEDGTLVIRDCGDDLDMDPFDGPYDVAHPCRECEFFCPVHQVCTKGFHISVEEELE